MTGQKNKSKGKNKSEDEKQILRFAQDDKAGK
jgi:hypothetical protein